MHPLARKILDDVFGDQPVQRQLDRCLAGAIPLRQFLDVDPLTGQQHPLGDVLADVGIYCVHQRNLCPVLAHRLYLPSKKYYYLPKKFYIASLVELYSLVNIQNQQLKLGLLYSMYINSVVG